MSAALSALFRGWWVRFCIRRSPAAPTPAARELLPEGGRVGVAHQVPSEVAATETMAVTAEAVVAEPGTGVDATVRARTLESLAKLQQIPALQSLAQGFLRAAARSDGSVEEVVASVEKDPALCVRVLRMANSAAVKPEQKIEDIFTAVQMLGLRRVSTLAHALFTMRDAKNMAGGMDWRHLWMHALATAAIAEEIERHVGRPGGHQLHLAALLHDVGKIVLSTVDPEGYRGVMAVVWAGEGRLDELEQKTFGVGHGEAGVIFARQSGLPDEVIAAIAHHADPAKAETHQLTVAIVSLANFLSKSYGLGFSGARLEERDGDLESQAAWAVIARETGVAPDVLLISDAVHGLVGSLKQELQGLREAA